MAWFSSVFFGACAVYLALTLHPRGNYLRLDWQGFETRSLFSTRRFDRAEIGEFGVSRAGGKRRVAFNLGGRHAPADESRYSSPRRWRLR